MRYDVICKNCGKPFKGWRKDAKFCCDNCQRESKQSGLSNRDTLALFVRSAYMRLWRARFDGEAYPAQCIDQDLLAAMEVHGHVVWSSPYHVWMTDGGVRVYAESLRDLLTRTQVIYDSSRELLRWLDLNEIKDEVA